MKQLLILSLPFVLAGCFNMPKKEELDKVKEELQKLTQNRDFIYTDSRDSFAVQLVSTEKLEDPEADNVAVTFSKGFSSYSGTFQDHLKSGSWLYNSKIKNINTINWFPFSIDRLGILTNLPENGKFDSLDVKSERYGLYVKEDSLLVLFHADTLTAMVKRRPYEDLITDQLQNKGYKLAKSENKLLQDSQNVISVTALTFQKDKEELYCKVAYAVMQQGYLAFATQFSEKNMTEGLQLFDGILTNMFFKEHRFYYPYKKRNKTGAEEAAK
ncbi:MAG: hypothetical protein ACTHMC_15350 [Pseudobacter sp.]|uniref:hypothetical protein n=1 Tax=Pseudobacter sp. TaxID=2045420 RepID=UPI003F7E3E36